MAQELARSDQGGPRGSPRRRLLPLMPFAYPDWLPDWYVNVLALSGLVACLLVGLLDVVKPGDKPQEIAATLGHAPSSQFLAELSRAITTHEAWPLFLWFCAVVMTIEFFVLQDNKAPARWIVAVLIVTLGSIGVVAAMHIPQCVADPVSCIVKPFSWIPPIPKPTFSEREYAVLNTILNFGLILLFVAEAARHWIRRMSTETWNPRVRTGNQSTTSEAAIAQPQWQELLSVDCFAAGVLILVLAGLYSSDLWRALLGSTLFPKCFAAIPFGGCNDAKLPGVTDPLTLTFQDLVLALCCLAVGISALSTAAFRRGIRVVGDDNVPQGSGASGSLARTGQMLNAANVAVDEVFSVGTRGDNTASVRPSEAPAPAPPQTPRSAGIATYVVLMLRHFIWPVLILLAIAAVSVASSVVQLYLALLDLQHRHGAWFDGDWRNAVVLLLPLILVAFAGVATVLACATLVFSRTELRSWLSRLGQVAVLVLNFFWGFALALLLVNLVVWLVAAAASQTAHIPFWPPAVGAYVSLGVFLVYRYGIRRRPPSATVPVEREPVPARPGSTAQR